MSDSHKTLVNFANIAGTLLTSVPHKRHSSSRAVIHDAHIKNLNTQREATLPDSEQRWLPNNPKSPQIPLELGHKLGVSTARRIPATRRVTNYYTFKVFSPQGISEGYLHTPRVDLTMQTIMPPRRLSPRA